MRWMWGDLPLLAGPSSGLGWWCRSLLFQIGFRLVLIGKGGGNAGARVWEKGTCFERGFDLVEVGGNELDEEPKGSAFVVGVGEARLFDVHLLPMAINRDQFR